MNQKTMIAKYARAVDKSRQKIELGIDKVTERGNLLALFGNIDRISTSSKLVPQDPRSAESKRERPDVASIPAMVLYNDSFLVQKTVEIVDDALTKGRRVVVINNEVQQLKLYAQVLTGLIILKDKNKDALGALRTIVNARNVAWITGEQKVPAREEAVRRLNLPDDDADCARVIFLSAGAGGAGLDLSGAQVSVSTNSKFNPSTDIQKMARIDRITQYKTTYYHYIYYDCVYSTDAWKRTVQRESLDAAECAAPYLGERKEVYAMPKGIPEGRMIQYCTWHDRLKAEIAIAYGEVDAASNDSGDVVDELPPLENAEGKAVKRPKMALFGGFVPLGGKRKAPGGIALLPRSPQAAQLEEESRSKKFKVEEEPRVEERTFANDLDWAIQESLKYV